MALFFDTETDDDDAAGDALQVVDLDDVEIETVDLDDVLIPTAPPEQRIPRITPRKVAILTVAFGFGMVLSLPIVAGIRHLQGEEEPGVDIEDRNLELPSDLPAPIREDAPPDPTDQQPTTTATDAPPPDTGEKDAFKQAAATATPTSAVTVTVPAGPGTTAVPQGTTPSPGGGSGTPGTTPSSTTSTTQPGSTTTSSSMPDPWGPDFPVDP
jgi:hypothetical protein